MRFPCVRLMPWLVIAYILCPTAGADPDNLEGGVLIAHHPPTFQYSPGYDWCEGYSNLYAISSCEDQNPRIDIDGTLGNRSVWYILAAWDDEKLCCGANFGLGDFDAAAYYFQDWGQCLPGALEISEPGWPGPSTGTAIAATQGSWFGNIVPVYYFAGYAYSQETIPIGGNASSGGASFGNCSVPSVSYQIEGFGSLGLFRDGVEVFPLPPEQPDPVPGDSLVACCVSGECEMIIWDDCAALDGIVLYGVQECPQSTCVPIIENPGPLEVLPHVVDLQEHDWTFLLRGISSDSLASVTFVVGEEEYPGVLAEITTTTASLWSVSYEVPDSSVGAVLDVSYEESGEPVTAIIPIDWEGERGLEQSSYARGELVLVTYPGEMGFTPGQTSKLSLCELDDPDAELERLLQEVGVRYVRKIVPTIPDSATQVENRFGEVRPADPVLYRQYTVYFNEVHVSPAIARILDGVTSIEQTHVLRSSIKSQSDEPPSNCPSSESFYWPYQLTLWGDADVGELDICSAWNQTLYGLGSCIGVVDVPIDIDVEDILLNIVEDSGWTYGPWGPDMVYPSDFNIDLEHGTWVAGAAAARLDEGCVVGVAPEASIVPYAWPGPYDFYAISALRRAGQFFGSGDIVCCAWTIDNESDELEEILFDMYINGITVLAGSADKPPGNSLYTISVGGCERDGSLCTGFSADILAPADYLYAPESSGCTSLGMQSTPSIPTALTAGFVALLQQDNEWALSPDEVLSALTSHGYEVGGEIVLNPYGTLYQLTPVGSCAYGLVAAEGGEQEVNLWWFMDNCEGVEGVYVHSAASCWGPWYFRESIPPENGSPTFPQLHTYYEPWDIPRLYRLREVGEGLVDDEFTWASPYSGLVPAPCPITTVQNLQATALDSGRILLQWDAWEQDNENTEYWIYRRRLDSLDDCGDGLYFLDRVGDESCDGFPNKRCYLDTDRMPLLPHTYRVAVAQIDPAIGRPMCWSEPCESVTVPADEVVGISDDVVALDLPAIAATAPSVLPSVISQTTSQVLLASALPGPGELEFLSMDGRVESVIRTTANPAGEIVVDAKVIRGLASGVHFVRWIPDREGGAKQPPKKLLLVD